MAGFLSMFEKRKKEPVICSAVVVAAGFARRMEGIDKMPTNLGELPVLVHTLYAFQDCEQVDEIIVVTREDLLEEISQFRQNFRLDKVSKIVVGGEERIHSVRAGLREVREDATLIAIHDGARPLVTQKILKQTIETAAVAGAAAPAIPLTDTIKRVEKGVITETVDRSELFAIQTPQIFEASLIKAATEKALMDGVNLTDDCAAVERLGMKVSLTEGSKENLKITTPFDLTLCEMILAKRVREGSV